MIEARADLVARLAGAAEQDHRSARWLLEAIQREGEPPQIVEAILDVLDGNPAHPHAGLLLAVVADHTPSDPTRLLPVLARSAAHAKQAAREAAIAMLEPHGATSVAAIERELASATGKKAKRLLAEARERLVGAGPVERIVVDGDPIDFAIARLGGDDSAALVGLVLAWQRSPQPVIADAIDLVGAKVPAPPLEAPSKLGLQRMWLELAERDDPRDLGTLFATPWPAQWKDGKLRLEALAKRRPDPRVSIALIECARSEVYRSFGSHPFWVAMWRLVLEGIRDPRAPVAIAELRRASTSATHPLKAMATAIAQPPLEDLSRLTDALAGELANRVEAGHARRDLLDAIYRDPDDDGPRLVYADWLLERGDPIGELIQIQLDRGGKTERVQMRENELLKQYRGTILGAVAPFCGWSLIDRGFVATVLLEAKDVAPMIGHHEWGTVREISFPPYAKIDDNIGAFLAQPSLASLHTLTGFPVARLSAVPQTVRTLWIDGRAGFSMTSLEEPALANVRVVKLEMYRATDVMLVSEPLRVPFERLIVTAAADEVVTLVRWVQGQIIPRLDIILAGNTVEVTGRTLSIRWASARYERTDLLTALAALPRQLVDKVRVPIPTEPERAAIVALRLPLEIV